MKACTKARGRFTKHVLMGTSAGARNAPRVVVTVAMLLLLLSSSSALQLTLKMGDCVKRGNRSYNSSITSPLFW